MINPKDSPRGYKITIESDKGTVVFLARDWMLSRTEVLAVRMPQMLITAPSSDVNVIVSGVIAGASP